MTDHIDDWITQTVDWQLRHRPPPARHACGVCHILWTGPVGCPKCGRDEV